MSKAAALFNSKPIEVKENPEQSKQKEIKLEPLSNQKPSIKQKKLRVKKKKQIMNKLVSEPTSDFRENRPYVKGEMSVAQVSEREARTIFVGNVGIKTKTKKKALLKVFKKFGQISNMWVRSLPLDLSSKINMKGGFYTVKMTVRAHLLR